MRQTELESPFTCSDTHPYLASIVMNPTDVGRFLRITEDQPDVAALGIDKRKPDRWTVFVACASKTGRDMLESGW
jgi:hypothetical protein